MSTSEIIRIRELDINMIHPQTEHMFEEKHDSSRLIIIGKPGTGKSTIIDSLMYEKSHIIPVAEFMSGSEDSNNFYSTRAPPQFIHSKYDEDAFHDFKERQIIAKKHLPNPWAMLVLEDVTDDTSVLKRPIMLEAYKNGRHWKMLMLLSLQYALDILPAIRSTADGIFILREPIAKNRKILYENYASIVPTFDMFNQMMDQLTSDYCALYFHNKTVSNKLEDCVFYYTAKKVPENFKFGCYEYHLSAKNRGQIETN
jgi:hypothetical protein